MFAGDAKQGVSPLHPHLALTGYRCRLGNFCQGLFLGFYRPLAPAIGVLAIDIALASHQSRT